MLSILETLLLHNNTRFSLNAWLIKPLPGFKGTNFGQLFEYLIERDALLIGLYRYGQSGFSSHLLSPLLNIFFFLLFFLPLSFLSSYPSFLPDSLTGGQQEPLSKFSRFVLTAPPAYAPLVLIPPNNADYFYIICTQNTIDALGAEVFRETARVPGTSARSSNAGL